MGSRTDKSMMLFLHSPCKGMVLVFNAEDAKAGVCGGDVPRSKNLPEVCLFILLAQGLRTTIQLKCNHCYTQFEPESAE